MKSIDGSHKWLTPPTLEGVVITRAITAPFSLIAAISGALGLLTENENWYQYAGDTPIEEVTDSMRQVLDNWYDNTYVGTIQAFVNPIFPPGWISLNGQTVSQSDFPELAMIAPLGWIDGGNIILPDLSGHYLTGYVSGMDDVGDIVGNNEITLTEENLPPHSHTYDPPTINPDVEGPGVPDIGATVLGTPTQTGLTGDGDAVDIRPLSMVVFWAIFTGRTL